MSDLKLGIDAQLTPKSISNIQKQLDSIKNLNIKIGVDTSEISKLLSQNGIGECTIFQW